MAYFITFLISLFAIIVCTQWYLGKKALRWADKLNITFGKKWLLKGLVVFALIYLNLPLFYSFAVGVPHKPLNSYVMHTVVYPYAIWGSSFLLIFILLMISDIFSFLYKKIISLTRKAPDSRKYPEKYCSSARRNFLKTAGKGIIATPLLCSSYGIIFGRENYITRNVTINMSGLPEALKKIRIAHISDIHAGLFMGKKEIGEWVRIIKEIKPDILFITGDFIASSSNSIAACKEGIQHLSSLMPVYGCLGNHDYWGHADILTQDLQRSGIRLFRNDGEGYVFSGSEINICGVEDMMYSHPDLNAALKKINPANLTILLSHNPNYFDYVKKRGVNLTLSGHTHGGQVDINFAGFYITPARLITRYVKGLFSENDCKLYVNSGLGTIGFPLRLNVPPEITVIRLA